MATLRELKGRIGSVGSSEKITGAMKMISSAKMHKAEGLLRRLTPYRSCIQTVIANLLASDAVVSSPLIEHHNEVRRVSLVVFGSDDGLCGAYNTNIFKFALESLAALREKYPDAEFTVIPVGRKLTNVFTRLAQKGGAGFKVSKAPEDINSKSDGRAVDDFGHAFEHEYLAHETDLVELVYMHFKSSGKQTATMAEFLPVAADNLAGDAKASSQPYIFEPDAATVFSSVIPLWLASNMQEAFSHNRASEQAARVMAMQSANDNAKKLLDQLQLEYNKLRQQGITTELLDIVGGQVKD